MIIINGQKLGSILRDPEVVEVEPEPEKAAPAEKKTPAPKRAPKPAKETD